MTDFSSGKVCRAYTITSRNNSLMQYEIILIGVTSSEMLFPKYFW